MKNRNINRSDLVVTSLHMAEKLFRHQDTKTPKKIFAKGFALCLSAFVAIFSGLGYSYLSPLIPLIGYS